MSATPTFSDKLRAMPLLRALVPMVAGIAAGTLVAIPLHVWVVSCLICTAAAVVATATASVTGATGARVAATRSARKQGGIATLYTALAIAFFGATLACVHTPHPVIPRSERVFMDMQITDNPTYRPDRRSASTSGIVIRWQSADPVSATSQTGSAASSRASSEPADNDRSSLSPTDNIDTQSVAALSNSPTPTGEWLPAGERLLVSFDTMYRFEPGQRIVFRGYVNPIGFNAGSEINADATGNISESGNIAGGINTINNEVAAAGNEVAVAGNGTANSVDTDSYSRLMKARGYTGRTYISQYSHPAISSKKRQIVKTFITKLQTSANQRLYRLYDSGSTDTDTGSDISTDTDTGSDTMTNRQKPRKNVHLLDIDELAVATAMTTGNRTGITPELRAAYSRTGASHLLAVSGLHVGIVFLIVNVVLYLLPLFPKGHIIKNMAAIVAIWFYAVLTGLSPSATRAAFMFTGAQVALATSRTRNATNIMCGTAMVMLALRPGLLFDISFQLSFIAVAAILAWFSPLYRLVQSRFKLLNALWATLLVGFVSSVATMPLVSHTFGVFSPAGIVLNPLVITTAHLVVVFSLVWMAVPVPLLAPLFRWLVGVPALLQNRTVELTSAVPGAAIEYTMPLWMVFAVYTAIIALTVWYHARPHRQEPLVLPH